MLCAMFDRFVERSPISVMSRGALERVLGARRIDDLFARTAEVQYTRELAFSSLVQLMSQVVLNVRPSVHAAYQASPEEVGVSIAAVYDKLDGVEPGVSAELVRDSAQELGRAIDHLGAGAALPSPLPGFRVKILDGNHLAGSEHRLQELRSMRAAALPGHSLVVLDPQRGLACDVFPCEDGHAQERSLLGEVLPTVQPGDLWIADRNFCTTHFLFGIAGRGGKFLIRQHRSTLHGTPLENPKPAGRDGASRVFEQRMRLTNPETAEELLVRRITVKLPQPTRDGDREIHVLTNVPAREATALRLARLYRQRWTIETMFQELTQTLCCEVRTLGYPKAALFAFCLALLAYNAVALVKAALRAVHGQERVGREVSGYYLSLELSATYEGMMIAVPPEEWSLFGAMTLPELTQTLTTLAGKVRLSKYRKHPRGPKKPKPPKSSGAKIKHVSTARVLAKRN